MKSSPVINSFNSGELSPRMYGRTDFEKYNSGCLKLENFNIYPQGGATKRPAQKFITESKNNDKIRVIPFIYSSSETYHVELGAGYIRFIKDGEQLEDSVSAGSPLEIANSYLESELFDIQYTQIADVMWLVHPNHPVTTLSRYSGDNFQLSEYEYDYPTFLPENTTGITLRPSGKTGSISIYSSDSLFEEGHVGSVWKVTAPRSIENGSLSGKTTVNGVTSSISVGLSDWTVTTRGKWSGRAVIQRSLDAGVTWENYIILGDTSSATTIDNAGNFTTSSDEPEPENSLIRISITGLTVYSGFFGYEIIPASTDWESVFRITGYVSPTEVEALVINDFQASTSDYVTWATSTSYAIGDLVSNTDASYTSTSFTPNANTISLCNDGTYFYGLESDKTVRKYDSSFVVQSSWVATDIDSPLDIEYYNNGIYILSDSSASAQDKVFWYDLAGSLLTTYTLPRTGYRAFCYSKSDNYFFVENALPDLTTYTSRFSTSFAYTGFYRANGISGYVSLASDSSSLYFYVDDGEIQKKTTGLKLVDVLVDTSTETVTEASITIFDGKAYCLDTSGTPIIYEYNIGEEAYYECSIAHTSSVFSTELDDGNWVERFPITTEWSEGAWSSYRGFPSAITFFENRLCLAGTTYQSNTIWLSQTDSYNNFLTGSLTTSSMELTLASGQVNDIKWLIAHQSLIIGTSGSEWALEPESDNVPVSPTSFSLKRKTTYGSRTGNATLVNNTILFIMRQGLKLREFKFDISEATFKADDLTILSNQIGGTGFSNVGYSQQPDNNLLCVREDGQLAVMEYEPTQNVFGWCRFVTDGEYESVSVVPTQSDEDEICVSVKRTIDGATKRYIEIFDNKEFDGVIENWNGQDSYTEFASPASITLTGLDYLEGETVEVLRDGIREPQKTVSGGEIEIESVGDRVVVGLPYTATMAPLFIEPAIQGKQSEGMKKGSSVSRIRFLDTNYAKVGQDEDSLESVNFRRIGDNLDSPVGLYSDYKKVRFDSTWKPLQTCYIVSDAPLPITVISMISDMEVKN